MLNGIRLLWAHTPRRTTALAGLVIGAALVFYGLAADVPRSAWTPLPDTGGHKTVATAIGVVAASCGVYRLVLERGRVMPTGGTAPAHPRPAESHSVPTDVNTSEDLGSD